MMESIKPPCCLKCISPYIGFKGETFTTLRLQNVVNVYTEGTCIKRNGTV